jgi:hypothetical protein
MEISFTRSRCCDVTASKYLQSLQFVSSFKVSDEVGKQAVLLKKGQSFNFMHKIDGSGNVGADMGRG